MNEGEEGAFVGLVSALDRDIKENANISYHLPGDSLFNIHSTRFVLKKFFVISKI